MNPLSAGKARFYHPELDGLRFLAFFFVFVHHAYSPLETSWPFLARLWAHFSAAGALGVDLFFCLSSFLITRLLLLEKERTGSIDIRNFYLRRILRIWPLYFAALGLAAYLAKLEWEQPFGHHLWPFLLMAGNWSSGLWSFPVSSLALLWSVSLEEQFYLLWPPVLRRLTARRVLFFAAGLTAFSIACRLVLVYLQLPHPAMWCLTVTRLDSLAAGMAAAVLIADSRRPLASWKRGALFGGGYLVWLLVHWLWPLGTPPNPGVSLVFYPAAALGAAMMLLAAYAPGSAPPGILGSRPLVFLGRISYGLYVFHMVALVAVIHLFPPLATRPKLQAVAGFALTVAAAMVSYFALEQPFLELKERFTTIRSRPA